MSEVEKPTAVVFKFFKTRLGLKTELMLSKNGPTIKTKLIQWGNDMISFRVKQTDELTTNITFSKDDIDGVDAVLFLVSKTAWSESYMFKTSFLKKMLDEEGIGVVNITKTNVSDYLFFDLKTANGWQS